MIFWFCHTFSRHSCLNIVIDQAALYLENKNFLTKPTPSTSHLLSCSISHLFNFDIGSVILIFPAVQIGKVHYRTLEKQIKLLFKEIASNFDTNKKTLGVIKKLN